MLTDMPDSRNAQISAFPCVPAVEDSLRPVVDAVVHAPAIPIPIPIRISAKIRGNACSAFQ